MIGCPGNGWNAQWISAGNGAFLCIMLWKAGIPLKTGVLFIHGFTGGPYEVAPFVRYLEERTDWVLSVPTLPGHGVELNLKKLTAEDWMMEAELALRKLIKEVDIVYIVGFSMGGLIALYLSMRYKVSKLVLLSAAAKYISGRQLLEDVKEIVGQVITGQPYDETFVHLYEYKLTHTPLRAAIEFLRIVRMVEPYYGQITVPAIIVQGKKDGIVPYTTAQFLYEKLGSSEKQLITSETGKHHICYSQDCEDWFGRVFNFLGRGER